MLAPSARSMTGGFIDQQHFGVFVKDHQRVSGGV
jgi:hypothetical protein